MFWLGIVAGIVGVAVAGCVVYKRLDKETLKEEAKKKYEAAKAAVPESIKKLFAIMVKKKDTENKTITFAMMDQWEEEFDEAKIYGDEISDEIHEGMVIYC